MKRIRLFAYAIAAFGLSITAHADILGSAWLVPDGGGACAQNAVIGCIPTGAANVTFSLTNNGLNTGFTSSGTNGTINGYILTDAAHLTAGPSFNIATTATQMNIAGNSTNFGNAGTGSCRSTDPNCGTIFEFTGTAFFTNGEAFTVNSDDGVTLYVGGTSAANIVLSAPGPQSLSTTNGIYTGATGTFAFTFVYAECCSLPAVFNTNLAAGGNVGPVPEPTSIVLFGTALAGIVGTQLRRRKKA